MSCFSSIVIDWSGEKLTGEQMLVIQNAALEFETTHGDERLIFEHPLCDGLLICKGRMQHGVFVGTRYVAFLDAVDEVPRKYEFLLTDTYRKADVKARDPYTRVEHDGKGGITATPIDAKRARRVRTSSSRVN